MSDRMKMRVHASPYPHCERCLDTKLTWTRPTPGVIGSMMIPCPNCEAPKLAMRAAIELIEEPTDG